MNIEATEAIQSINSADELNIIHATMNFLTLRKHSLPTLSQRLSDPANFQSISYKRQKQILNELFFILNLESDFDKKKMIAEMIGVFTGKTGNLRGYNFLISIISNMEKGTDDKPLLSYCILESLISTAPAAFQATIKLLSSGLKRKLNGDQHKISALRCFSAFLKSQESQKCKKIHYLAKNIYRAAIQLAKNYNNKRGLEELLKMIEFNFGFFDNTVGELIKMLRKVYSLSSRSVKVTIMKIWALISQKSPLFFQQNLSLVKEIFTKITNLMTQINSQVTQDWVNNCDTDANQKQQDLKLINCCVHNLDILIQYIGAEHALPILQNTTKQLFQSHDWRHKHAAIMAISLVGEYIDNVENIQGEVANVTSFFQDPNPKMRYAACHAIGLIFDYAKPREHQDLADGIFAKLLALIQSDPIPRVVSHSVAALTNFVEGMQKEHLVNQLERTIPLLLDLTANGIHLEKYTALSAISSIMSIANEHYGPYLRRTIDILFEGLFTNSQNEKQSRQIKTVTIETLTIIAAQIENDRFQPWLSELIQNIADVQTSFLENSSKQQMRYIFNGWQRLCNSYPEAVRSSFNHIPPLFVLISKLLRQVINSQQSIQQETEIQKQQTKQCTDNALGLLQSLIETMKNSSVPFIEQVFNFLCSIVNGHTKNIIKYGVCECISTLIKTVDLNCSKQLIKTAKICAKNVLKNIEEFKIDNPQRHVDTLCDLCGVSCLFTEQQIVSLLERWMNVLRKLNDRFKISTNEEIDEDEENKYDDQLKLAIQTGTSKLINALFKAHNVTLQCGRFLIHQLVPVSLAEGQTESIITFGIALINACAQAFNFTDLNQEWESFAAILFHFFNQQNLIFKELSSRGIGILIQKTPSYSMTQQAVLKWLELLTGVMERQKTRDSQRCRNSVTIAIGRILKAHSASFDLRQQIRGWIGYRFVGYSHEQGSMHIGLMIDIVTPHNKIISGWHQIQSLRRIFELYGNALRSPRFFSDFLKDRMRSHILSLELDVHLNESLSRAWRDLVPHYRQNITNFMA